MGIRLRQATSSFIAGEFTPLAKARHDITAYKNGAEKLTNRALLAQGGTRTRPALRYLATIANPTASCKLIPFVFSTTQSYAFAMLDTKANVYNSDGTLATTLVGQPWASSMFGQLNYAHFGDTLLLFHPSLQTWKILRTGSATFSAAAMAFETLTNASRVFQPYYKFVAQTVTMTPSATTGSITLTMSSAVFDTSTPSKHIGTYFRYAPEPTTAAPNPTLYEINITAVTDSTHATGTVIGGATLGGTAASTNWDEQVFSAVRGYANSGTFFDNRLCMAGSQSHPSGVWVSQAGAYFNFDLGTSLDNQAIWDSIVDAQVAEIRHVVGVWDLLFFSDRSLWYSPVSPNQPLTPKNWATYKQQPYGSNYMPPIFFDGAVIYSQDTGNIIREALWNSLGVFTTKAYTADPISLLGAHLIKNPSRVVTMYSSGQYPEQYAIMVNDDGTLTVFQSIRTQQVAGWVPWSSAPTVAGSVTGTVTVALGSQTFTVPSGMGLSIGKTVIVASSADNNNYVKGSITAYSGTSMTVDVTATGQDSNLALAEASFTNGEIQVPANIVDCCSLAGTIYAAVERYLGGAIVLTLEVFDDTVEALDCCATVTSALATRTFSAAFPHLAGQTVTVRSNGHYIGDYLVASDGTVTLDSLTPALTTITAGLAFTQRIRPMPARFDLPTGTSAGLVQGLVRSLIQVDSSLNFKVDGQDILLNFAGDDAIDPAPTLTGFVEVRGLGYDRDGVRDILIEHGDKVTVLGMTRELAVNE